MLNKYIKSCMFKNECIFNLLYAPDSVLNFHTLIILIFAITITKLRENCIHVVIIIKMYSCHFGVSIFFNFVQYSFSLKEREKGFNLH